MLKVYLHVGMPKCASSSIQSFFYRSRQKNLESGLCYPSTGRTRSGFFNHGNLARISKEEIPIYVRAIKEEALNLQCDKVFISCEEFVQCSQFTKKLIDEMNCLVGRDNFQVLFLFRNHFPFVESVYAQFLKGGIFRVNHTQLFKKSAGDLQHFCEYFEERNGFKFYDFGYMIRNFEAFGLEHDQIKVFSIEKEDLRTGNVINEICQYVGLPLEDNKYLSSMRVNERFSRKALLALQYGIENCGFEKTKRVRQRIAKRFAKGAYGFSTRIQIGSELVKTIQNQQNIDREFFQSRYQKGCLSMFLPEPYLLTQSEQKFSLELSNADKKWVLATIQKPRTILDKLSENRLVAKLPF